MGKNPPYEGERRAFEIEEKVMYKEQEVYQKKRREELQEVGLERLVGTKWDGSWALLVLSLLMEYLEHMFVCKDL